MTIWTKIKGTVETAFQIGLAGPQIKNNASALEARNAADSAFVVMRGATPVGDNDLANKQYVDTTVATVSVTAQFNGNNALPTNTGTEHFYVVTTSGSTANIGTLIWDDGSGGGNCIILAATSRLIAVGAALTGGTISLSANSVYYWTGSAWSNVAGTPVTGALQVVKLPITNAASQSSTTQIPANATVRCCALDITTPYSAGATITVGQTGTPALLMGATDSLATVAGLYQNEGDISWGASALAVLVTVAGTPAAGAGFVLVHYTQPNA